jgi:hypothetical protein
MKNALLIFLLGTITLVCTQSCKKDSFITSPDARLRIDADSIKFDTVFASTGSVTQFFRIVNENDQQLRLSSVKLMGGNASAFKININGAAVSELKNIEIAANDSIYVFVTVLVNPTTGNLPFIITDSISVEYNGNQGFVQLQAYGQNAHFLNSQIISNNTTWPNDLPYVILGSLYIAQNASLTLEPGVKVYVHADAPLIVDGTLLVNGIFSNKVIFTGDRLDEPYKNYPSSWPGIFFREGSKNNSIRFAEIKNAYQALAVSGPSVNASPKLIIQQCIIDNAYSAGLLCSNTTVQVSNTLISNCANNINIQLGGDYSFIHCTAVSYSSYLLSHKTPVMSVANFAVQNGSTVSNSLQAIFTNCIFWGDNGFVDDEIAVNKQGSNPFTVTFSNCLYRAQTDPSNAAFNAVIKNQDPLFDSIDVVKQYYDFRQNNAASPPGINKGTAAAFTTDLDSNKRAAGLPDIGCYEKQ